MRGLLRKDLALAICNRRTLIIFAFIAVMLIVTGGEEASVFAVSYLTIVCGMTVLTTISYDEFEHGMSFLMTLPVSRKGYVLEKYLFGTLSLLTGWIVSMGLSGAITLIRGNSVNWMEWFTGGAATAAVLFLLIVIMLPVQLKFGGEKGRVVLMSLVVIILIVAFSVSRFLKAAGISITGMIDQMVVNASAMNPVIVIGGIVIIFALVVLLSIQISFAVVNKKEY